MKIVFIGNVEFSKKTLGKLIELKADIVGVITKAKSDFNADFADVTDICRSNGIPFRYTTNINSHEDSEWIRGFGPDIIFCFGWSQLLKKEILSISPMGVIGYHPAKLPRNRGRHPLIWALVLGLSTTASSFFFMDEDADNGGILSQTDIAISYEDNARTLYDKIIQTALEQISEFLPTLQNKTYTSAAQDHTESNVWRKRIKKDGELDFRMSSLALYNLVRGLAKPYVGAHIVYKGKEIKIWSAKEVMVDLPNIEYGKVLSVEDKNILVKCYDNAVLLTEHEISELPETGEYLL